MDGLRLALLILGIVVVAVVYFWTARRRRLDREAGDFDRFDSWTNDELDPLAPSATNERVERAVDAYDDGVVDADELTQPNLRMSAIQDALGHGGDETAGADEAPVQTGQLTGTDDRAGRVENAVGDSPPHASMPEVGSMDDAGVIDDLQSIAGSVGARVEPRVGSLDQIDLEAQDDSGTVIRPSAASMSGPDPATDVDARYQRSGASDGGDGSPPNQYADRDTEQDQNGSGAGVSTDSAEMVVVLNVMARTEQTFDGPSLQMALEGAGLKSGAMQLYHYRAETQSDEATPIFSALNAVKPGTLDVNDFDGMRTPGIALILRVHGLERPSEAFELMLVAARRIAEELDGQVCDESRSTLTGQALNHLRERIAAVAFRARSGS